MIRHLEGVISNLVDEWTWYHACPEKMLRSTEIPNTLSVITNPKYALMIDVFKIRKNLNAHIRSCWCLAGRRGRGLSLYCDVPSHKLLVRKDTSLEMPWLNFFQCRDDSWTFVDCNWTPRMEATTRRYINWVGSLAFQYQSSSSSTRVWYRDNRH